MAKRLGRFELPKRLIKDEATATSTYALFVAEPLEPGYGHTLGNSFRRILLSSIEGAAITSVKIDGVQHEFQSIDGIVEDATDIVLNLKKVLIFSEHREPIIVTIEVDREGAVTAADINTRDLVTIVNPEQLICTLGKKRRFRAELEIKVGRGYCPAEDNKQSEPVIGVIPVDALYSPVKLVKYSTEHTRVGQITDYDRLNLEIWTDGRITPEDALKEGAAIFMHHLQVFDQASQQQIEFETQAKSASEEQNRLRSLLMMSVNEIELSVRAANCLNNAGIISVGELAVKTEAEMLKYRNFGKKSLNEIKQKLEQLGLSLGMKIDPTLLASASHPPAQPEGEEAGSDDESEDE